MMNDSFFFADRHQQLAERLATFTREQIAPRSPEPAPAQEEAEARTLVRLLAEAGLLRYVVPASFGGERAKLDARCLCLIREALTYHSALADMMFGLQGLGSYPITLAGEPALQKRFLPAVATGQMIAAFALTEPEAGSDVSALQTTAERVGDEYVLNGQKRFISNAGVADFYVVFARTEAAAGTKGLSAFVVEKDTPGLELVEKLELIAPHPIGQLSFTDCRVPASHLLGAAGQGFKLAMTTLDLFRATVGAAALGMARRALDEAVSYTRKRQQFGKPLAEFQGTQMKLAEMATALDAARLLVYRAAWLTDTTTERTTRESAMAKLAATESAQKIIDAALQLHGGIGLIKGATVERLYREIRALRIYEGTSEIQKLVIGRTIINS